MKISARYILVLFVLLAANCSAFTQPGFYIPATGKVFFTGDTSTIFSNVINHGQLGIGERAVLNFKGIKWDNDNLSIITDESNLGNAISGKGGMLRFLLPDAAGTTGSPLRQILSGGYNAAARSGPAFPNVAVANPWGIELSASTTKIRNLLRFESGHIYATDNILVVGDTGPGTITGFDDQRFVVTGTAVTGGFLLREKISSRDKYVVFPVGTSDISYTPAAVNLKSAKPDDFYVRVADSVRANGTNGNNLSATTVNKTWQVGKLQRPGQDNVHLRFQHLLSDEGALFAANRRDAYVSLFASGAWDTTGPQSLPVTPGFITSGAPLSNAGVNARSVSRSIGTETYFTKSTGKPIDTGYLQTKFRFWAFRWDWDNVSVDWTTEPEINISYFIVQRRLSNENVFSNIDTVASQALGGISYNYLKYMLTDPNNYKGTSFYRLILVDYSGHFHYSQIVPVGGRPEFHAFTIWPNPTTGHFYAGIGGISPVKSIVVWNVLGQKILEKEVNGLGIIPMDLTMQGTYFVGFISFGGSVIETKKLVVVGR